MYRFARLLSSVKKFFSRREEPLSEDLHTEGRGQYPKLRLAPNGFWYIHFSREMCRSLKTRDELEAARLFRVELDKIRTRDAREKIRTRRIMLSEFMSEYLSLRGERLFQGTLVAGTLQNDKKAFQNLLEFSGDIPLRELTPDKIEAFRAALIKDSKKESYIQSIFGHLNAAFNHAWRMCYIDSNPFRIRAVINKSNDDRGLRDV